MHEVRIRQILPRISLVLLAVIWGCWVVIPSFYNRTLPGYYDCFSFCCVAVYFVGICYPRASSYIYCFFCFPVIAIIGILSYCLGHYAERAQTELMLLYGMALSVCLLFELADDGITFMIQRLPTSRMIPPTLRRLITYIIPVRRHGYATDVNILYDELTIQLVHKLVVAFRSIGLKVKITRCTDITRERNFVRLFEASRQILFVFAEGYISKHCKLIADVIDKQVACGQLFRKDVMFLFCNCDLKHILGPVMLRINEVRAVMLSCNLQDEADIEMNLYEYKGILLKWSIPSRELYRIAIVFYQLWLTLRYPVIYYERPIEIFSRPINVPQIES